MTRRRYKLAELLTAFKGLESALNPPTPPPGPSRRAFLGRGGTDLESRVRASARKTAGGAAEGTRHDAFRRIAAVCRSNGLTEDTALYVARDARNYLMDATGFSEGEAEALVRWAYRIGDADWRTPAFEDRPAPAGRSTRKPRTLRAARRRRWRSLRATRERPA